MECLRTPRAPSGSTLISGDNIGIVRYAAGIARLTEPSLHGVLDSPLGTLSPAAVGRSRGWRSGA
eukprot:10101389-Lingulodinium_polyedra.AAC.1